jgi:hypothetical protein
MACLSELRLESWELCRWLEWEVASANRKRLEIFWQEVWWGTLVFKPI